MAGELASAESHSRRGSRGALPVEVAVVWLLYAVVCLEISVTYARIPARELYHVSHDGLAGGLGRTLVFLNFPVALAAIAVVLVVSARLSGLLARSLALLSLGLCAVVAWPGVVDQTDLDPKPINAVPALGVGLALALTFVAARDGGFAPVSREWGRRRLTAAVVALALAIPWLAADLGFYLDRVPLAGRLFETGALRSQPGSPELHPTVHHGHHHGMDGTLLVLTALLLVPAVSVAAGRLRSVLAAYVSLMLCYGVGNLANDVWLEQVVKRGWTSRQIPGVIVPEVSVAWGVIVLAAAVAWLAWRRALVAREAGAG